VVGVGNPEAKVFIIGQTPGKTEDAQGKPFVGPAGKVLDDLLAEAGLTREEVYITNLVKCFAPRANPRFNEVRKCWRFWSWEIEEINPKIVVLLGAKVIENVLGLKYFNVSEIHGSIMKKNDRTYYLTFHPASMLHNYSVKDMLFMDFKKLGELL